MAFRRLRRLSDDEEELKTEYPKTKGNIIVLDDDSDDDVQIVSITRPVKIEYPIR